MNKASNSITEQISSLRVFAFPFLAILAVGLALAPVRLAAQEAVPAAGSQVAAPVTATPEGPKSQEEQNQAFRLEGPLVKWTAKTFNLNVETAATIFEFTNFVLIVLLVGIPIARILPKIFHKRSETLVHNLKTAREATADANARLSAVERKLAGLDDEIKKFRIQVEQESKQDEARIKASLAEESARIVDSAEQELGAAAAQARRSLRSFAADLAIEQAARQLVLTPETDRALIAEFIGDVSGNGTKKEGQN
ncbi:MAG TPA: ATP synthase F0 subunit B [Terracidiphilus sp.]|nr:ATP synthase F0 subunit B [Terracidiphilus sp.]